MTGDEIDALVFETYGSLLAYAKAKPGAINFAISGAGSPGRSTPALKAAQ